MIPVFSTRNNLAGDRISAADLPNTVEPVVGTKIMLTGTVTCTALLAEYTMLCKLYKVLSHFATPKTAKRNFGEIIVIS